MSRRAWSLTAVFLILCGAGGLLSCEVKAQSTVNSSSTPIPYHKIGLNVFPRNRTAGPLADQMRDIASIGVKYIRVNFWFDTQYMASAGSAPDFSRFDEMVEAAQGAGLEVLGILGPAPAWLAGSGDLAGVFANSYAAPVVARYKGYVRHWEVWNEPDEDPILGGSPEAYFDLLKAASSAIRREDPGAKIISAATVNIVSKGDSKFAWMDRLLDLGLAQYADILNLHYYSDMDVELGINAPALIQKAGLPVWVTETGKIGQDRQLDYFKNNIPYIEKALNPERIYWYCYVEHEGENTESHPADTYGIVAIYKGQRNESPVYSLLKSH